MNPASFNLELALAERPSWHQMCLAAARFWRSKPRNNPALSWRREPRWNAWLLGCPEPDADLILGAVFPHVVGQQQRFGTALLSLSYPVATYPTWEAALAGVCREVQDSLRLPDWATATATAEDTPWTYYPYTEVPD